MSDPEKAFLYHNGKLIGLFPYTGLDEIDAETAKRIVSEKGLANKTTPLDAIVRQAQAFEEAAKVLFEFRSRSLTVPFVVNGCFCIELYLKAIHVVIGSKKTGHSLKALYNEFPDCIKSSLQREFDSQLVTSGESNNSPSFESEVNSLSGCFVEWRYFHEKAETTVIKMVSINHVIQTIKSIILELK